MNNYKLLIQYDGTDYAGWQYQVNAITIQQKITESIKILLNEYVFALNEKNSATNFTNIH